MSWWIGLSRADLKREAERRAPLMSSSPEGSKHYPYVLDDWSAYREFVRRQQFHGRGDRRHG